MKLPSSSGIYIITNKINNKVYIGQATNIRTRINRHLYALRNNQPYENNHLQRAYNKYGECNFIFNVLELVNDIALLETREQYWIDYYRNLNIECYNQRPSSKSNYGVVRGPHSPDAKQKISESKSGKILSQEHILNAALGHQKPIVQIDKNTGEIIKIWSSAKDASLILNINNGHISNVCKGRLKTIGGFVWQYQSDNQKVGDILEIKNQKVSISRTKRKTKQVAQIDKDTNQIIKIYDSVLDASTTLNINQKGIYKCCINKRKISNNYKWEYIE